LQKICYHNKAVCARHTWTKSFMPQP